MSTALTLSECGVGETTAYALCSFGSSTPPVTAHTLSSPREPQEARAQNSGSKSVAEGQGHAACRLGIHS